MRGIKFMALGFAIFGVTVLALAQVPASLVGGEISGFKNCTVTLFRTIQGAQQKYAAASLSKEESHFSFGFPVSDQGEFVKLLITDFDVEGLKEKNMQHYQVELFIRQGSNLEIQVNLKQNALQPSLPEVSIAGASPENDILLGWQKIFQQFRASFQDDDPAERVKKFTAAYGQYKPKLTNYISGAICKINPKFEQVFRDGAKARLQFAPIDFYGAQAQELDANPSASFDKILKQAYSDLMAYCNDGLFQMEGISNLNRYYHLLYREKSKSAKVAAPAAAGRVSDDSVKTLVCNQTVKKFFGVRPSLAISPKVDTNRRIIIPPSEINSGAVFVRVQLEGFSTTGDFTLTAFEKVTNRTLAEVRATDNYLLVPVLLKAPTMLSFDIFDLKAKLFLKPGDSVDLRIYNAAATGQKARAEYAIIQGSAENRLLANWYANAAPVTRYLQPSMAKLPEAEIARFQTEYDRVERGLEAFMSQHLPMADAAFQNQFRQLAAFDMRLSALMFLAKIQSQSLYAGPHFKAFDAERIPDFFKPFGDGDILCSPHVFRFPDAHQLVSYITKLQWALMPINEKETVPVGAKLGYQVAQLCSPEAKSCLLNWDMRATEPINWREVRLNLLPNKGLLVTEAMQTEYNRVVNTMAQDTQMIGKPVVDAAFPDSSGRMVRFSDFKGKVVFVDVWATWCAPCREQLPYLKKIEEAYHGNPDMVFVGLSVDRERDHGKWKKFIATEKLPGTQIIDFAGKVFQRPYAIEGIPRFILIDRKGNISEIRCPFPITGEELKRYLDELLAQP